MSTKKLIPEKQHPPMPLWLVTFVGALLFLGGIYLQRYSGGYAATVYNENAFGVTAERRTPSRRLTPT